MASPRLRRGGDLTLVRATLSRSLSSPAIWGFNPIGEKYGLRSEVVDAITNADQQRNIQTGGVQVGSLGYQSAAVMAEQNIGNVKIIAGMYVSGQNLIMRKGVQLNSWKDIEGKKIGRAAGNLCLRPVHACRRNQQGRSVEGEPRQHHAGRRRRNCRPSRAAISTASCCGRPSSTAR